MNPNEDHWDEQRMAELFTAAGQTPVPPDEEFLDRLRERSTETFAAEFPQPNQLPTRRRKMFFFAIRGLAGAAAAAVVVGTCLWSMIAPDDSAVALGSVLQSVAKADTLHLEITRGGKSEQIWASRPNRLRWNHADGTYKIARGDKLWLVDEKANRATSQASPYFRTGGEGLDLLALLDVPLPKDRKVVLERQPEEQTPGDDTVYRMEWPTADGKIRIEAFATAGGRVLHSLEATSIRLNRPELIAKITVKAVNQPVDESLFIVGDTLTEDGRLGKVTDLQGIVSVKPVMHRRWTPVGTHMLIKPGDWVRTDLRGANAVALRLVGQTDVTLGPGSLIEVIKPNRIRLIHGVLKVTAGAKAPVELLGPGDQKIRVKGRHVYRLDKKGLVRLQKDPLWLQGFESATNNESLGSLIAKVDGRNVPLTVGYHKVSVDVRDQIARTVIEESFVNRTNGRLEGVFYFPLPQDASISGFGMWIGNELVEADVVEKQRAREIYETILRERRDPGLLEWSGGNLFKARVFPIEPHSEKRIKITYTQVLPLKGNRYRYSYALQSEMLKQNPLRELAIDVRINSVAPLKSVTSPTHTTRIDTTAHSAHVEFAAQEYTPTRDFEVVIETAGRQSEVVVIPHRRGDDGYFLMQLTPPDGSDSGRPGDLQREVLADGQPVELLILADTSGSIDSAGRQIQADFIASLLGSLTPEDKINLACCDVQTSWIFKKAVPATEENVKTARDFLAIRIPLGWTDLDKAFASALKQCGPRTQVIYIGDGIGTTGDADPVALAKRLKLLFQDKAGSCHAVTVSSSFEPIVLSAIASLGGGSFRQISGEKGPQAVAVELLGEMSQPTIRDLKVEFKDLRTARVYPEQLPNLAAGTQQILLGRYLPEGEDQLGEVIVTGVQGEKPIRFHARVSLKDAEHGNSFIPRLWARMYLDALLQQGASSAIKDEIVALSEEYHIMTPYTSLLVLESDADRERFKVKRRFQMRDGQKFFAEGRDNANYELIQQQMKRAGDWRLGLRRDVLRQLLGLGRDARVFAVQGSGVMDEAGRWSGSVRYNRLGGMRGGPGGIPGFAAGGSVMISRLVSASSAPMDGSRAWGDSLQYAFDGEDLFALGEDEAVGKRAKKAEVLDDWTEVGRELADAELAVRASLLPATDAKHSDSYYSMGDLDFGSTRYRGSSSRGLMTASTAMRSSYKGRFYNGRAAGLYRRGRPGQPQQQYTQWLGTLFPHLPAAPPEQPDVKPEKPWPAEARALAKSLLRTEQLARLDGGLRIEIERQYFDTRWDNLTSRSQTLEMVSPRAWLTRAGGWGSQTMVNFCDAQQRGVFSKAFGLGRLRTSTKADLGKPPLSLYGYTMSRLDHTYQAYSVELQPQGDRQTLLVLKQRSDPDNEIRFLIDTARHAIVSRENYRSGKLTSTTTCDEFVEVAGAWWAGRVQTSDKQGRRTSQISQTFKLLDAEAFDRQMKQQLADRDRVQFLREPLVKLVDAKRALADGKASFDDRLALMLHFCGNQQWPRVLEHLDEAERIGGKKPGMRWVRYAILKHGRRREELKQLVSDEAAGIAKPQAASSEGYFLAEYLRGQAAGILQANEMLALLDVLKPVYGRQPQHQQTMKSWTRQRVNYVRSTGQPDEALRLQEQLARDYPRDYSLQQQYAQAMANVGEYDAAYAWLDRTVADENAKWRTNEENSLRSAYTQLLRNQGRYPDMVEYMAEWIKRDPATITPYQQYLSALIRTDQIDEANALIAKWLQQGRREGELPAPVTYRLQAAVNQALGRGYNMHTNRLDERWLDPLAETALLLARHKTQANTAEQIMGHGQFQRSDQCRGVRTQVLGILTAEIRALKPQEIQRLVGWIWPNDPAVEAAVWRRLATALQKRWAAESDPRLKHDLGQPLARILSGRLTAQEYLDFLRRQLQEGPKKHRTHYANQLFNALLGQPFSAEYEDEAFGLLERLSEAKKPAERLAAQVQALYRLTDRMVRARHDARMAKVEHQEELTRVELSEKKKENLRLAREEFSDRLRKAIAEHPQGIGQWMNVERLYLETLLGRKLDRVEQECWELLGAEPPQPPAPDAEPTRQDQLDEILRGRALITLANLAARKGAKAQLIDRLLSYIDRGIETADPKDAHSEDAAWKFLKHQLLIALDRPEDLQKDLQRWIRVDDPDNRWRLSLGYLLAEQGNIDPAITHFEAVEADDELGPKDYRTLADWYMAVDSRDKHERALISVFKMMQEWQLSQWISARLRPWQRSDGQLPSELDQDVLRVFAALFEKSGSPQNYLYQLRNFYRATRDFRLLAALPDAVVGHTAAKVYPFLQGMGSVLAEVRDEATADSIVEHLAEVRKRAKTTVDHRALDLLELLVERRSAELLNQPGPHVDKALAAMQRAFKREWSSGEPRLMADLLSRLGRITQGELAEEQLRELDVLHQRAEKGSIDRLHIGHSRAKCLWSYARRGEAIDLLQTALDEYQAACGGVLPTHANGPLGSFVSYLEQQGHHARGETVLFDQLKHPANRQQTYWLTQRLYRLYCHAIQYKGDVSLGSGLELYRTVQRKLQDELDTPDHNHRYQLIERLCNAYHAGRDKKYAGVADDLRAFAFKLLPEVLKRQTNNYQSLVGRVAFTVHSVAGARDGLAFIIERIENEPQWFHHNNQDGWRQHSSRLAQWRKEVKDLGDLEGRLLAIVLTELRRDLESRQQRYRTIYYNHNKYYWKEKESDFRKTAEEVYAQRKHSGAAVRYIADYLYYGPRHYDRAIKMLLIAHGQKRLDEGSQARLVRYLHERSRYGESIAILQPLVELRPENIQYRVLLMHAYFRTNRPAELLALLKQTDAYFHQKGRWSEAPMAALAKSCLDNHLYEQSTAYYEELIPLHQRNQPRRGIGNGTLSQYYRYMSLAYAGLGNTVKAVDAACGAIVSWGPTHKNRRQALDALAEVLRRAPDLDDYVAELDKQCEETQQENPIVRKALGIVYSGKNQYAKAIVQLKLACEAQPNDTETHRQLIACYDKNEDRQGALQQLLASLQLSRRDIKLYKDLGKRLDDLKRFDQAQRAYTSIVEMLPNESESHTMLAEIRQQQDRWHEAIPHWRRVAEIRALEPTGLLKLAAAEIHERQWDAAAKTLRKLDARGWPSRFGDVHGQVRNMERDIERSRKD